MKVIRVVKKYDFFNRILLFIVPIMYVKVRPNTIVVSIDATEQVYGLLQYLSNNSSWCYDVSKLTEYMILR